MADGLINTLEQASEFDALAKLRPGEPYFLLIGRDALAPALVQEWASANRTRALEDGDAERITRDQMEDELRKSTQAEQIGWAMKAYKRGEQDKATAAPKAERPTYTGHELPEETKRSDLVQRARALAASACNSCVAELHKQAREFEALGCADEAAALDAKVMNLRRLADLIKPRRPLPGDAERK